MTTIPDADDVRGRISRAVSVDNLNPNAALVLVDNLNAVALAGCGGLDVDAINTDDVTLVAVVLDASSSMSGLRQAVVDGYSTMLDAFQGAHTADSILVSAWSFDTDVRLHHSYIAAPTAPRLTTTDYTPDGGTALYSALMHVMTGMVAYGQMLRDSGLRTRGIVIVFSDGDDNSSAITAQQVRTVSAGLLAQEIYTLAYAGFGSDLRHIADAVGFPDVITTASSASDLRRIFRQVSASVIRTSQNRVGVSNSFFVTP